jgi:hypothetical protein
MGALQVPNSSFLYSTEIIGMTSIERVLEQSTEENI